MDYNDSRHSRRRFEEDLEVEARAEKRIMNAKKVFSVLLLGENSLLQFVTQMFLFTYFLVTSHKVIGTSLASHPCQMLNHLGGLLISLKVIERSLSMKLKGRKMRGLRTIGLRMKSQNMKNQKKRKSAMKS